MWISTGDEDGGKLLINYPLGTFHALLKFNWISSVNELNVTEFARLKQNETKIYQVRENWMQEKEKST